MFVFVWGGRVGLKQNPCSDWCAPPDGAIWESSARRSRRGWTMTMTSQPRVQQQTPSCFSENKRMFVCGPFFLFQDSSCELKMWRHSTLTFVSLVTDSLCVGLQRIGGMRGEEGGRLRVALWCWVLITWAAKITKQSDSGLCLHTVAWFRSPELNQCRHII